MSKSVIVSASTGRALARLREAGAAEETIDLLCRCTVTGGDYVISLGRVSARHRYQARAIRKIAPPQRPGALARLRAAFEPARPRAVSTADLDLTGADECPCCGWKAQPPRIGCDLCGLLVCGGRSRRAPGSAQGWLFACADACGATGLACVPMMAVNAASGSAAPPVVAGLLGAPARAALPPASQLKLGRRT